jgi:3-methylfumaryl-CoA hydratase
VSQRPLSDWIGSREEREERIAEFPAQAAAAMLDLDATPMVSGAPLPALWHWFYFLPRAARSQIDVDGHPQRGGFFPPVTLPRRMFAGARTRIHQPITIGEMAQREGEILAVREKSGKSGQLVFVTVRYRISQGGRLRVEEEQDIVYKEPGPPIAAPEPLPAPSPAPEGAWVSEVTPDSVLLFRFSALTFNAHRIHYDLPYAREQEGYPGLVVHGPLTAVLLAGLAEARSGRRIARFTFQGRGPLFALHPFRLIGRPDGDSVVLDAQGPDGTIALSASAELASTQEASTQDRQAP